MSIFIQTLFKDPIFLPILSKGNLQAIEKQERISYNKKSENYYTINSLQFLDIDFRQISIQKMSASIFIVMHTDDARLMNDSEKYFGSKSNKWNGFNDMFKSKNISKRKYEFQSEMYDLTFSILEKSEVFQLRILGDLLESTVQ